MKTKPNTYSLLQKIKQIASTLLPSNSAGASLKFESALDHKRSDLSPSDEMYFQDTAWRSYEHELDRFLYDPRARFY